jgi:Flp pilus assembly protein TadG
MKAIATLNRQNGAVLVITVIALFVILGMAGLAIDSGHSFSNKTRLQNSVDAAALAAAMKLLSQMQSNVNNGVFGDITVTSADNAGAAVHTANLADFGTNWLTSPSAIQFCWSKNLNDFSTCATSFHVDSTPSLTDTAFFVRAEVASTSTLNFIMQVIPGIGATRSVGAAAVAGTIGHLRDCNISPFYVCDKSSPSDADCSDGSCFGNPVTNDATAAPNPTHFFAINMDSSYALPAVLNPPCTPSTVPADDCVWVQDTDNLLNPLSNVIITKAVTDIDTQTSTEWDFNSDITFNGNRLLLNLVNINGQSEGGRVVRENIIYPTACIDPNSADTQPGNMTSIRHAFNALFGEPGGDVANFPNIANYADWVTANPISFRYYKLQYDAGNFTKTTRYHQRLRNVPVVNCPDPMGGNIAPVTINGYACFFMSRKIYQNETGKLKNNEDFIIAEHVDNRFCPPVEGLQGGNPKNILDAKIVLFQYYGSTHS